MRIRLLADASGMMVDAIENSVLVPPLFRLCASLRALSFQSDTSRVARRNIADAVATSKARSDNGSETRCSFSTQLRWGSQFVIVAADGSIDKFLTLFVKKWRPNAREENFEIREFFPSALCGLSLSRAATSEEKKKVEGWLQRRDFFWWTKHFLLSGGCKASLEFKGRLRHPTLPHTSYPFVTLLSRRQASV